MPTLAMLIEFARQFLSDVVTEDQVRQLFNWLGARLTDFVLKLIYKRNQKLSAGVAGGCDPKSDCCVEAAMAIVSCQRGDHDACATHLVAALVNCSFNCPEIH